MKAGLLKISQNLHLWRKEKEIPHLWHVDSHGHDAPEWKQAFYHFAQKVFQ